MVVAHCIGCNVQMDANLVNPDDIESISVLKDAASASIYGARALMALS